MLFWHVVFISFNAEVPEEVRERVIIQDKALGMKCGGFESGIVTWKVVENLDQRKGIHFIQVGMFLDKESFDAFRAHPEHKAFGEVLRGVANWTVGDFIDDVPNC